MEFFQAYIKLNEYATIINTFSGQIRADILIEECSELIKELCKDKRNKGNKDNTYWECIDVLVTLMCYMKKESMLDGAQIMIDMGKKMARTINRYNQNNEI